MTSESYTVAWTSPAKRALRNLPEKAATAAVEFIYGSLTASPHRVGKGLRQELTGLHSARRGGYRIIYRINEDQRAVEIVTLEHRSDAYRSRLRLFWTHWVLIRSHAAGALGGGRLARPGPRRRLAAPARSSPGSRGRGGTTRVARPQATHT